MEWAGDGEDYPLDELLGVFSSCYYICSINIKSKLKVAQRKEIRVQWERNLLLSSFCLRNRYSKSTGYRQGFR